MFNAIITAKQQFIAAWAEEQLLFVRAKELLQQIPPNAPVPPTILRACAEADDAMDRLQLAMDRVEQLQLN